MKSPRWESSSSPIGVSRLTGSWLTFMISRTFSGLTVCGPIASRLSTSTSVGSRSQLVAQLADDLVAAHAPRDLLHRRLAAELLEQRAG